MNVQNNSTQMDANDKWEGRNHKEDQLNLRTLTLILTHSETVIQKYRSLDKYHVLTE